nr:S1 family peptidase [Haladaptatus sp. R4]
MTDTSKANWGDSVSEGDLVRLSNNHVYARVNEADFGEPVIQPSPMDGGSMPDDKTGELRGYVTVEDDALVDVAARSVTPEQESTEYHKLDDSWPTSIRRDEYRSLKGQTVTKSGRTTGVTSGDVKATGATVRVNYGDAGAIKLRDQCIAGPMSKGGDSGSPVFLDSSGELVGLLFAGSERQTIFCKIGSVESELGVELLTEEPGSGGSGGDDGSGGDGGRGGSGGSPTYHKTFDTTVSVSTDGAELSLESFSVTGPADSDDRVNAVATSPAPRPEPGGSLPKATAPPSNSPPNTHATTASSGTFPLPSTCPIRRRSRSTWTSPAGTSSTRRNVQTAVSISRFLVANDYTNSASTTPSCWSIARLSGWSHRSTISPSSMRVKTVCWTSISRPVGSSAPIGPSWVPRAVSRMATVSPSATMSSTFWVISGNAATNPS